MGNESRIRFIIRSILLAVVIILFISVAVSFNISSLLLEEAVVAPLIAKTLIIITYTLNPAR